MGELLNDGDRAIWNEQTNVSIKLNDPPQKNKNKNIRLAICLGCEMSVSQNIKQNKYWKF